MRVETAERELEWARYKLTSLWKFELERLSLLQDKTGLTRKVRRLESELLALAKRQIVAERQIATKTNANAEEVSSMQSRIAEAETKAFEAAAREEEARLAVDEAEAEGEEVANNLAEAEVETDELKRQLKWAAQREDRLRQKNENLQSRLSSYGMDLSQLAADERSSLSREAGWKRESRERVRVKAFLESNSIEPRNLAQALAEVGMLKRVVLQTKMGFDIVFAHTDEVLTRISKENYGIEFALNLHFEFHLTMQNILQMSQAGCKQYHRESDKFVTKVALHHPFRRGTSLKVPRLAPPASKILPIIKRIHERDRSCHIREWSDRPPAIGLRHAGHDVTPGWQVWHAWPGGVH